MRETTTSIRVLAIALGFAPPAPALFGTVDLAGAIWTAAALRKA